MKRVLVLHGPNLNLLGTREPHVYGTETLVELEGRLYEEAVRLGLDLECFQSNHEGALIDRLQISRGQVAAALLNPGGLTHSSVALRDAVAAVEFPVIEVHLSNLFARERFRQRDLLAPVCRGVVMGFGPNSYLVGLQAVHKLLQAPAS